MGTELYGRVSVLGETGKPKFDTSINVMLFIISGDGNS